MKVKHLITIADLSSDEIWEIIETATQLKWELQSGQQSRPLAGKTLGMIFEKPSLRTRVSFEIAMLQLGGHALYLSPNEIQLGKRESIPDVARVLSRYVDCIMVRTFAHRNVETLAQYSRVPVINGLSDLSHPCQALGDMLTIYEKKGKLKGLRLAFVGDGNNVAHSLLLASGKLGIHISVASPPGYECNAEIVRKADVAAKASGGSVRLVGSPSEAVAGADVLYTDVWTSMGQEDERERRLAVFAQYQVNANLVAQCSPDVIVMHCLPAHRGEEITDDVIDGPHSVVFDQAENRMHVQKAILLHLMPTRS